MRRLVSWLFAAVACAQSEEQAGKRATVYLAVEVPRWKKDNGCFSCHNNGDAARALMASAGQVAALRETLEWLKQPAQWDSQQSDAPFRDKNLARIQFSFALADATRLRLIDDREPLRQAARLLTTLQSPDGSWTVEDEANVGSPATYGAPLATYAALRVLVEVGDASLQPAWARAGEWLARSRSAATPDIAARILAARLIATQLPTAQSTTQANDPTVLSDARQRLLAAQNPDGGWGPYRATPSEAFDTAIALLALRDTTSDAALHRGIRFLVKTQLPNGGWPATTRPSGVSSYAQHISTTGWALLALQPKSQ